MGVNRDHLGSHCTEKVQPNQDLRPLLHQGATSCAFSLILYASRRIFSVFLCSRPRPSWIWPLIAKNGLLSSLRDCIELPVSVAGVSPRLAEDSTGTRTTTTPIPCSPRKALHSRKSTLCRRRRRFDNPYTNRRCQEPTNPVMAEEHQLVLPPTAQRSCVSSPMLRRFPPVY